MVSKEVINERLEILSHNVGLLLPLRAISEEDFLKNEDHLIKSRLCLQIAIQSALDIGNHLIADLGLEKPKGYEDIFPILGKARVLPHDFAERTRKWARLRNRLVHLYHIIDFKKIHEFIKNDLGDFESFARHIIEFLKKSEK